MNDNYSFSVGCIVRKENQVLLQNSNVWQVYVVTEKHGI